MTGKHCAGDGLSAVLDHNACDPHGDLLKKVKLKEATFFFAHQNFAWVNIGHQYSHSKPGARTEHQKLLDLSTLLASADFFKTVTLPKSKPGSATRRPHSSPKSGARSAASAPPRASPEGTASCRHHGELRRRPKGPTPGWVLPGGGNSAFLAQCQRGAESGVTPFPSWVHHRQGLREEVETAQRGGGGAACQRMSQWVEALRARCPTRCLPTTCRVAAFTPPCLPPAAAGWVSAANPETPNSTISREASTQSSSATTSQGYVLPEGKIMPNTVFVGGIDVRMDETEIRSFFARYGSVKEVKIITDRTGVSKGYGFVSFYNDVDVQKIVESQINFHGKKLKLGPAIRKQNLCAYHVQPRPLVFNPPPPPQFQSVWSNPNTETYMQPPTMMNPITQYVQAYPPYPSSPVQVITGYQLPVYNYQMPPQWPAGEQRSYVIPPAYTAVNYHCNEVDPGAEVLQSECSVHEATPSSGNGPQKKSVDRSIQTVVSCLFNPENRLRNSLVTQDDYFKDKRVHHFRRSRAVLKSV
ncbi:deleted in azoospermia-like [Neovison vison]|uniref:deleted in azoospermia-like n=1 Tax=Neovison vison TaxID=452646 RepID=UPI001CEFF26B|nr:deleted in azoospermia-like [Neogale vison]